jgi:hypothetical protein
MASQLPQVFFDSIGPKRLVFGCRDGGIIHALQWPASEKIAGVILLRLG